MLGLVGKYLRDHEKGINHCMINDKTGDRINLQPWYVVGETDGQGSKSGPAHKPAVYAPATQEDFKWFVENCQGGLDVKNPTVGELPTNIAKEKQEMYDKAIADYKKKETKAPATQA